MSDSHVQDPLKSLADVGKPDQRHSGDPDGLSRLHGRLSSITLHAGIPIEIRQLFETAKNISLYSWHVYRFHQVSELVAYSALESALRTRAIEIGKERDPRGRPWSLHSLLTLAKEERWIQSTAFPSLFLRLRSTAQYKKTLKLTSENPDAGILEIPDVTQEEIEDEVRAVDMASILLNAVPFLRNELAHGSVYLSPRSVGTLRRISEVINQLFPE